MVTRGGFVNNDWSGPQYYNFGGEPSKMLNARQVALRDGLATNATPEERTQLEELGVSIFSTEASNIEGSVAGVEMQPQEE